MLPCCALDRSGARCPRRGVRRAGRASVREPSNAHHGDICPVKRRAGQGPRELFGDALQRGAQLLELVGGDAIEEVFGHAPQVDG